MCEVLVNPSISTKPFNLSRRVGHGGSSKTIKKENQCHLWYSALPIKLLEEELVRNLKGLVNKSHVIDRKTYARPTRVHHTKTPIG